MEDPMKTPRNGPLVLVSEQARARATGWGVACAEHGPATVLFPGKTPAVNEAKRHLVAEHGGMGRIVTKHAGSALKGKRRRAA